MQIADPAAFAFRRARETGRVESLMAEEPSRRPPRSRALGLACSGVGFLLLAVVLFALVPDDGHIRWATSRRGLNRWTAWGALIPGLAMTLVGTTRWLLIRALPPGRPRLVWVEAETSRPLLGGVFAVRKARLTLEDGTTSTWRVATTAWMLMTHHDVGVAWFVDDLVVAYRTIVF